MKLLNALGLLAMRALAVMPLPLVRGLGWLLGRVLHAVAARRRRIARTNWALCFAQDGAARRERAVRDHFVAFAQAWLDRSWLWHGRPGVVRRRLRLHGALGALGGEAPVVIFAPHFVGLDAGWTALTQQLPRRFSTIYAEQLNPDVDRWIHAGRMRFGNPHLVPRRQGLRPVVAALRAGEPLYLLPDMDYGAADSLFVPFFGVPTATIPSLPRFAQLARARVVPVVSRLTPQGYDVEVLPPWEGYPGADVVADTALMNERLQALVARAPEQYYWVHKRFKTRPPGESTVYGRD